MLFAAGLSYAGMKLYVKPKEAMERVAGTGMSIHETTPLHPSLVFHDIVKAAGEPGSGLAQRRHGDAAQADSGRLSEIPTPSKSCMAPRPSSQFLCRS